MSPRNITVVPEAQQRISAGLHDEGDDHERVVTLGELKGWGTVAVLRGHALRYRRVRYLTTDVSELAPPLKLLVLLRVLSRGACFLEDASGRRARVTLRTLARALGRHALTGAVRPWALRAARRELDELERSLKRATGESPLRLDLTRRPLYLRTDLVFDVRAGGSVAHTAGVINNLGAFTGPVWFVTSTRLPTVSPDVETVVVPPPTGSWSYDALAAFRFNDVFYKKAREVLGGAHLAFVYQRYSINNVCGIRLARDQGVPFVLEYNGSEVWVGRNWGQPMRYEDLATRGEEVNLRAADLVVVVSDALRVQLEQRGVDPKLILVNPNGADVDRYRPDVDGSVIRRRFGLAGKTVVGFIGTFGRWHGAEVLADAFVRLVRSHPDGDDLHLLLVGDGVTMPESRQILEAAGLWDRVTAPGLVPQEEGPAYLAACDILVSPHVPNPDGSPFFGSPTKLFEYLAMGKAIVASRLDQIGEVLEDGRTALLVPPRDAEALAEAMARLVADPALRARLGTSARQAALDRHSWRRHTQAIVDKLVELHEHR